MRASQALDHEVRSASGSEHGQKSALRGTEIQADSISKRIQAPAAGKFHLLAIAVAFGVSRLIFHLAGIRFDMTGLRPTSSFEDQWQLLDVSLLKHQLLTSVWNLQSQPPLYNLTVGILVHFPHAIQTAIAEGAFMAMGLVMVIVSYLAMVELRVPRWVALVIALLIVVNPEYVLFENWLFYAYPTAALFAVAAFLAVRYVRLRNQVTGVSLFGTLGLIVLTNSTFQIEWMVAVVVIFAILLKEQWRRVVLVSLVPLLIVFAWYAKGYVQFGTFTTSSWLGMNLTKTTTDPVSVSEIRKLVDEKVLTPLALIRAFGGVNEYVPTYIPAAKTTGVAALDMQRKADQAPNYNNILYVALSSKYLHNDLAYIKSQPADYLSHVGISTRIWFVPGDQYFQLEGNNEHIAEFSHQYDTYVMLQGKRDPLVAFSALLVPGHAIGPSGSEMSLTDLLLTLVSILGAPFVIWSWRGTDHERAAVLGFIWLTVSYGFVLTSLVELGENNRFRFELGVLPAIGTALILTEVSGNALSWWTRRKVGTIPESASGNSGEITVASAIAANARELVIAAANPIPNLNQPAAGEVLDANGKFMGEDTDAETGAEAEEGHLRPGQSHAAPENRSTSREAWTQ